MKSFNLVVMMTYMSVLSIMLRIVSIFCNIGSQSQLFPEGIVELALRACGHG